MKTQPPPLFGTPEDVELQFYEALQTADLERLMDVWADDEDIACVHPGGVRLQGPSEVRQGFESVLQNGPLTIERHSRRSLIEGGTAIHHVVERVKISDGQGVHAEAFVLASNVYVQTVLGWRMVLHHASPGQAAPVGVRRAETPQGGVLH